MGVCSCHSDTHWHRARFQWADDGPACIHLLRTWLGHPGGVAGRDELLGDAPAGLSCKAEGVRCSGDQTVAVTAARLTLRWASQSASSCPGTLCGLSASNWAMPNGALRSAFGGSAGSWGD